VTASGSTRYDRAVVRSAKGVGRTKYDNTSGSARQPGRKFVRRRGMMGRLCFVFSDVAQNFDSLPLFLCENFHVLNVTGLVGQKV
jgi:hypothetical protein